MKYGTVELLTDTLPQLTAVILNFIFLCTIVYKMRISAKRWGIKSRDKGLFFVQVCSLILCFFSTNVSSQICFLLTTIGVILESIPDAVQPIYLIAACFGALQVYSFLSLSQ